MSGWELTAGLKNLRSQVDKRWPDRNKTSDGTIGDAAHQDRTSGHNPDDTPGSLPAWNGDPDTKPEVRSWDMDHDIGSGVSGQMLVDHMRALPKLATVIRYMNYKGKIYHERTGFKPEPSSGHETHIHFEGAWTQEADNNTSFDFQLNKVGDSMAVQDVVDFFAGIDRAVRGDASATSTDRAWRDLFKRAVRFGEGLNYPEQDNGANLMPGRFDAVDADNAELKAAVAAIVPASGVITDEQIRMMAQLIAEDLAARLSS